MKYKLKGLDCANCANKMEIEINKLDNVETATVNFNTKTLLIEFKDDNNDIKIIEKLIKKIEPNVELEETESEEENDKLELIKIIISLILFLLGLLFIKNNITRIIIFTISYIIVSYDIIFRTIKNIIKGSIFDETFLMTISTIGAFCINEFSEGVAVMLFYKIGEYLQDKAVDNSRKSISELMNIKSDYANLKIKGEVKIVNPIELKINDIIIVKAGEKVPVDGIVIDGESYIDTSCLTGETVPRKVTVNDEILSGSINNEGLLTIKVTKLFSDSTVSKILDLVENATNKKSNSEKFISKFARIYTPIVVLLSVLIAVLSPLLFNISFYDSIYKALVCLVISCPCALVISIPLSYFGGIGCASKNGILVKGSNYLDLLTNVDSIVFDKTGTLTKGVFEVTKINPINIKENELLKTVAYAEYYSNHPIVKNILKKYDKKIDEKEIKNYKEISGNGISVKVSDKDILVGNKKLFDKHNITIEETNEIGTIIYVSIDKEYKGYIVISDIIKDESKSLIESLNKLGITPIMLTGDNYNTANEVSKKLGIKKFYAELLPSDKVNKLEEIINNKQNNKNVCFVGDGINDAPVLARSDIGFAMGGIGSDSAIESSDVVIMNDDLSKIIDSIMIAKKTKKIVIQNITLSLTIKLLAIILGILGIASIWSAVIADVGVTIVAVINSLRCLKYQNK